MIKTLLIRGAMILVVAFFTVPILYLIMVTFKSQGTIALGGFFPKEFYPQNWPDAFNSIRIGTNLANSFEVAIGGAALTMILAVPATHAVVRHGVGGRHMPSIILGTYIAPPIVALFPLFLLLRVLGLVNSEPGLALVYGVMNLPVAFWLLSSFVRRLPVELEEAASIDGAGYFATLTRIVVPLLLPGIVSTAIICLILDYNEFLLAGFLTRSADTQTLPVGLSLFQGDRQLRYGQMAVASLVGMAPVYLLAALFQRGLVRGLTSGAVK